MYLSEQIRNFSSLVLGFSLGPYMMLELNPEEGSLNEKTEQKKLRQNWKRFLLHLAK